MRKNERSARILAAAFLTAIMGVGTVSAAAAAIAAEAQIQRRAAAKRAATHKNVYNQNHA